MAVRSGFAAIIVNWNGWQDTVECLESIFRGTAIPDVVVVCDNDSSDGSIQRIRDWADGLISPYLPPDNALRGLIHPPGEKPLPYVEYDRSEAERGGDPRGADARLVLIRTGGNLGFAGGTNVGLRYLLEVEGDTPIWLLNPDTLVEADAAASLLAALTADGSVGMCGSSVRYHDQPHLNQALGGAVHSWWLAFPRHIGADTPVEFTIPESAVEARMSFVYAASMMVTRSFLRDVGLLDESYFLFFEELDYAMRGRQRGYTLGYASKSVVYHKGGASSDPGGSRSLLADYYFLRNRIRVTRKYRPIALPGAYAAVLVALMRRAWRRDWERTRMVARLLIGT